jgi:hypothetical protein
LSAFGGAIPCQAKAIYVDDDANGLNDGSSWVNAYKYLQDALSDANSSPKPVEIRVAQGVYKPDQGANQTPGDREATFQLINGVALKGGYAGFGEPDPNARNIDSYKSILSSDLDGNDVQVSDPCDLLTEPTRAENSYHVVTAVENNATAILDGFTITGGNANGEYYCCEFSHYYCGGGMYNCKSSPRVTNCRFRWNSALSGGAMYNNYYSDPTLLNCSFTENSAYRGPGGAICNIEFSEPVVINCSFIANWARDGGGVYSTTCAIDKALVISDSTFCGNFAELAGGGMWGCGAELSHCVFKQNKAGWGGAMLIDGDTNLTNCLFTGNSAYIGGVSYAYDDLTVSNCTFGGNRAHYVGGISSNEGYTVVTNSIFWENTDNTGEGESSEIRTWEPLIINYCCILGWTGDLGGIGNTGADPCFAKPGYWDPNGTPDDPNDDFWVDGDYHFMSQAGRWDPNSQSWLKDNVTSPCIDAGDPVSPIGLEPFPNGGIINMGAYGGTEEASKSYFGEPVCETIVAGDINGDCKVDYRDLFFLSLNWLADNRPE